MRNAGTHELYSIDLKFMFDGSSRRGRGRYSRLSTSSAIALYIYLYKSNPEPEKDIVGYAATQGYHHVKISIGPILKEIN